MEHKNFLPKIQPNTLCEIMGLCTVRMKNDKPFCGVKRLNGSQYEIPLEDVANESVYEEKDIVRSYASGCVFIEDDKTYLVATERKGNIQYQYTGGSPMEKDLQDVHINDNGIVKLRLDKIYDNAILRTFKRTGAEVIECYNNSPLVDRALIENKDDEGDNIPKIGTTYAFCSKGVYMRSVIHSTRICSLMKMVRYFQP